MHDDDLIDRLRRATTQVPPSTLDLTVVLRSARRKRARHRTVVATGCVAAVAGAGAVAPAVSGLLDGDEPGPSGVAAAAAAACPAGAFDVSWSEMESGPVVRYASLVEVSDDGTVEIEEVVPFFPVETGLDLHAPHLPAPMREAVLAQVREQDELGIYRDPDLVDEQSAVRLGADDGAESSLDAPFDGLVEAESELSPRTADVGDLEPGVYAAYDEGVAHTVRGTASCGDEKWPVRLTYRPHEQAGVLDCAEKVADGLEWAVKDRVCPDGATTADAEAVGLTSPQDREAMRRTVGTAT